MAEIETTTKIADIYALWLCIQILVSISVHSSSSSHCGFFLYVISPVWQKQTSKKTLTIEWK